MLKRVVADPISFCAATDNSLRGTPVRTQSTGLHCLWTELSGWNSYGPDTVPMSRVFFFLFGHTMMSPSCSSWTNRYRVPALDGIFSSPRSGMRSATASLNASRLAPIAERSPSSSHPIRTAPSATGSISGLLL